MRHTQRVLRIFNHSVAIGDNVCTAKQHKRNDDVRQHGRTDSHAVRMHSGAVSGSTVRRIPTGSDDRQESRGVCIKRATFPVDVARTNGRIAQVVGSVGGQIRRSTEASRLSVPMSGRGFGGLGKP